MTTYPPFGAGLWHFASYLDRYATDGYKPPVTTLEQIARAGEVGDLSYVDVPYPFTEGVTVDQVKAALAEHGLQAIGVTPEIYMRKYSKGAFTNPDPAVRADVLVFLNEAAGVVRELGARYLKVWPGQDGWDYPFQVDHGEQWRLAVDGMRELAQANADIKIVIEYKPREPRNKMFWDSSAKTALGIKAMGVDNVGVLLDFGHALFGGESPAAAAQLLIDHGLLWAMDVNDNLRSWDDDMMVGSVHPIELFEYFYTLKANGWEGVWQLDQFPFREDTVETAKLSIRFLKHVYRALEVLDIEALKAAQAAQDALGAQKVVQDALFGTIQEDS
ncbi:sugar phosphate isomerase/epimerase [Actinotalea sp. M2MS4P-6]|uniref:sugar phosphate isomerase/epimerase family protein n=1 Tax=Actinotalea sp. M2MS4P-6 TaxID=2983762 RepID=UPI0021E4D791|nr:sugar phosphate isomerase/epimerase family protein [Actinotalea sp. M2MS4P-6]MCV2394207.1 sugar phosphate isomerase/epimerase [Actinotalea sp. M2MS4P-6]